MPSLQGSITALITPFKDGKVDTRAFQKLVEWQIDQGSHGLVPCGTTGESPTLTHDEHRAVIELCIAAASGRGPCYGGTGPHPPRGGGRAPPPRQDRRRRRRAGGDALLQQADARRPL